MEEGLAGSDETETILTIQSGSHAFGIYPNKLKIYVHTKICTEMFIVALFKMPKVGSNQRCPSVGDG